MLSHITTDLHQVYLEEVFTPQLGKPGASTPAKPKSSSDIDGDGDVDSFEKKVRQLIYDVRHIMKEKKVPAEKAFQMRSSKTNYGAEVVKAAKEKLGIRGGSVTSVSEESSTRMVKVTINYKNGTIDRRNVPYGEISQLRSKPTISSVEISSNKVSYSSSGKGLDPVGREDSDINNNNIENDPSDKYLLNRRKVRGSAIATRKEDFIWSEETTSTEGQNKKKLTGKGVDNYSTGVVKVSPDENSAVKKEEYSSGLRRFHSALQFEATMTSAEKKEEKKLKNKYDKSGMKDSMKKQYGEKGKNIYFATIRKKAMQNAHYEFEDGTLLDEMGMPILGVVKKDSAKKEGPSCDTNSDDMRSLPTKVNLIKNKMRAMGLKMSYEPEGKQIDEIAPLVAAGLAAGAALAGGAVIKRSQDAAKSGVDAAKKGQKIKPGIGIGNAAYGMQKRNDALKDAMKQYNSYEPSGSTILEREFDEPGEEDWRPDVRAHNKAVGYRGGYKPYKRGQKPGTSGPGSQAKPAD